MRKLVITIEVPDGLNLEQLINDMHEDHTGMLDGAEFELIDDDSTVVINESFFVEANDRNPVKDESWYSCSGMYDSLVDAEMYRDRSSKNFDAYRYCLPGLTLREPDDQGDEQ